MYLITPIDEITSVCRDPDRLVVVEESPDYPGNLLFQTLDDQRFLSIWGDWISRYMCLSELFMLRAFVAKLEEFGYQVIFTPSTQSLLEGYRRWERPLVVEGFTCPGGGELYPYQTFTLNRSLELASRDTAEGRLFFVGFCTGSGKSLIACAGAQELFNRDMIDLALVFATVPMKPNLAYDASASFAKTTELDVVVNDGSKQKREGCYAHPGHQVFVLNYEKAWADFEALSELTKGKRVLFVLDEAQKLLTAETSVRARTKTRKHYDRLVRGCEATVWPLSASVVNNNPLRYRDVYNLAGVEAQNPLGTIPDFVERYSTKVTYVPIGSRNNIVYYQWSNAKLHEVRHRVSAHTQSVRKSDPTVRELFKSNTTEVVPIHMSPETRKLYDWVLDKARQLRRDDPEGYQHGASGFSRILRYICDTPLALQKSSDPLAAELCDLFPKLITNAHCAKLDFFLGQVEAIAEEQEKVVAFTTWTNLGLLLLAPEVQKRKINHVLHYGVGQKDAESRAAQHVFKTDPEVTLFFSSDAGALGLNLPEAKYCISYQPCYSYDLFMQRSERINRADSKFATQTYAYVTQDSIEERVWETCEERRNLAAATTGANESLNYGGRATRSEKENLDYLIFGEGECERDRDGLGRRAS